MSNSFEPQEDSMRNWSAIPLALAAGLALLVVPAFALDRPAHPSGGIVTRVADLDRPAIGHPYRRDSYAHWRYRAAYTRWLHNEYVVAGYPVNQYRARTYFWVHEVCCARRWRW
jgi:hypothetical protein